MVFCRCCCFLSVGTVPQWPSLSNAPCTPCVSFWLMSWECSCLVIGYVSVHWVCVCWALLRSIRLFPKAVVPSSAVNKSSYCSTSSAKLDIDSLLSFCWSRGVKWYLIGVLIFISLIRIVVEHLTLYLWTICVFPFVKFLFGVFALFILFFHLFF